MLQEEMAFPPSLPPSSPFHDPVISSLPMSFQPWLSSINHCRGQHRTAEDTEGILSLILLLASLRAVPPPAHRDMLSIISIKPMVGTRNACSEVFHFTPQALAEQGAHHEASISACSKTLQLGEQQFAPNIPQRCSWDHGAAGRLMRCKALSSAHINHTGLVPVLFKASLFSSLWQISILC